VHRFDPDRGIRLASYALKWIEAEVREYILRNWRLVRLGTGAAMKKLFFGYRQAVTHLRQWGDTRDVTPTVQALAHELDLDEHQVRQAQAYFQGQDESLEAPLADDHREERRDLGRVLFAHASADPAWVVAEADQEHHQHTALTQALASLPERDRAIVTARLLQEPPVGLAELGQQHGVSAERVRQIEKRALADLRKQLITLDA
jgi:RNA polymerase sigma-32 factor